MMNAVRPRYILALYAASFLLPAVFEPHPSPSGSLVQLWGWQAARLSVLPLLFLLDGAPSVLLLMTTSNPAFLAAAAFVAAGWRRTALLLALVAFGSMVACALMLPDHPVREVINTPGGRLGPGYYLWAAAGLLMCLAAYRTPPRDSSSRSVRPRPA